MKHATPPPPRSKARCPESQQHGRRNTGGRGIAWRLDPARNLQLPLRVLIADDYADAAESLSMLLACVGIETQIALDGEEALERASAWHPHICVLDVGMPRLDGRELARRIRAQSWAERPLLIALTGWTSAQDRRSALEAGFDHYLTKPADPAKLVRVIRSYLADRVS